MIKINWNVSYRMKNMNAVLCFAFQYVDKKHTFLYFKAYMASLKSINTYR